MYQKYSKFVVDPWFYFRMSHHKLELKNFFKNHPAAIDNFNKEHGFDLKILTFRYSFFDDADTQEIRYYEKENICLNLQDEASPKFEEAVRLIGRHLFYFSSRADHFQVTEMFKKINKISNLAPELREVFNDEMAKGYLYFLSQVDSFSFNYRGNNSHIELDSADSFEKILVLKLSELNQYSIKILIDRYNQNLWPSLFYEDIYKDITKKIIAPYEWNIKKINISLNSLALFSAIKVNELFQRSNEDEKNYILEVIKNSDLPQNVKSFLFFGQKGSEKKPLPDEGICQEGYGV